MAVTTEAGSSVNQDVELLPPVVGQLSAPPHDSSRRSKREKRSHVGTSKSSGFWPSCFNTSPADPSSLASSSSTCRHRASPLYPAMPRVNSTLGLLPPSHAIVEAASTAPSAGVTTPPGTGGVTSRGAWLDRCLAGVPPQPPCHSHTTQSLSRTDHVPPRGFSTLPRYASSRFNSRSVATLTRYCGGGQ